MTRFISSSEPLEKNFSKEAKMSLTLFILFSQSFTLLYSLKTIKKISKTAASIILQQTITIISSNTNLISNYILY